MRFVTGSAGDRSRAANMEVKCFDAAANPYLAVAGLLATGRAGLAGGGALPAPVEVDPHSLGTVTPLPSSLGAALEAFENDAVLKEALGEAMIDTIALVRRGEIALFDGAAPDEIAARTRWKH